MNHSVTSVTRRTFLASSTGAVAACVLASAPSFASGSQVSASLGTLYGVTGRRGLKPGTIENPGGGIVMLGNGRRLVASFPYGWQVGPGKAVLVSSEPDGRWLVVYVER